MTDLATYLDLQRAALCLSCEAVFNLTLGRCPRCASGALVVLARWLEPVSGRGR